MNAEIVMLHFHLDGYLVQRREIAMVTMVSGERVRDAILTGAKLYARDDQDLYAFVRFIPAGAQAFAELPFGDTLVTLVQADWVPQGVVMVGRGGEAVKEPIYTGKKEYMEVLHG